VAGCQCINQQSIINNRNQMAAKCRHQRGQQWRERKLNGIAIISIAHRG